jgi:hypothetical protein
MEPRMNHRLASLAARRVTCKDFAVAVLSDPGSEQRLA